MRNIAHHFYHAPLAELERKAGIQPSCRYAPMTILHEYAGKLLNDTKTLVLPPVEAYLGATKRVRRQAKEYRFDSAKLETMDGETIPDVILYKGEHRMHVEFYVTHRCTSEKRAKLTAAGIAAIEVDLSGVDRNSTVEEVDKAILNSAPREWIYNRKSQEIFKELQDEAEAEARAAKERRHRAAINLAKAYATARDKALAANWNGAEDVVSIVERGDAELLVGSQVGEGYFTVHPNVWKAATLNLLRQNFGHPTQTSIVAEFASRDWLVKRFRGIEHGDLIEEAGLPPGGPQQAIKSFLQHLKRKGIAAYDGWRWGYTHQHLNELEQRARNKQRLHREAAERASRHSHLRKLVDGILAVGNPAHQTNFNIGTWLDQQIGDTKQSARQIADAGDKAWQELLRGLQTALAVLKDETEAGAQDFGLPVGDALRAMLKTHEERAAQRRLEAEEKDRQEREARVHALIREAKQKIGDESEAWLDRSFQKLNGMSPRKAAVTSDENLQTARWILDQVRAAHAAKAKWVIELEREAINLFCRAEADSERLRTKVSLYMSSGDPDLRNRASPKAHTKDEDTMRECLALLKRRIGRH